MRHVLALLALVCGSADAAVTASVAVSNVTPASVVHADGSRTVIDGMSATLQPGESLTYEFDYILTVSDDGLPAVVGSGGPFWSASAAFVYSGTGSPRHIPLHDTEFALANLYFDFPFGSNFCPPWIAFSATWDYLATAPDDAAQRLSKSSHGLVSFAVASGWNVDPVPATLPHMRIDTLGIGQPASRVAEIPEPAPYAVLLAGLLLLGLHAKTFKRI